LGFPLGGLLALVLVGSMDGLASGALGGALAGAAIGVAKWLVLQGSLATMVLTSGYSIAMPIFRRRAQTLCSFGDL